MGNDIMQSQLMPEEGNAQVMGNTKEPKTKNKRQVKIPKALKFVGIILIVILVIYIIPTIKLMADINGARGNARLLAASLNAQNLDEIKANSQKLNNNLKKIKGDLVPYYPLQIIPFFGGYIADANHGVNAGQHGLKAIDIAAQSLTPYADLLGLKGKNIGQAGTAEERLQLAVATIEKITPEFDKIAAEFQNIKNEIGYIKLYRYPSFLFGKKMANGLAQTKLTIDQVGSLLVDAKPLVEVLPAILGSDRPKTYLVLFQNDKELRPSGGFLTAYTYLTVDKGKISAADSSDMYNLDEQIQRVCRRRQCFELKPPSLILRYLPEPTGAKKTVWDSRDSNIHPDYAASALEFQKLYNISGFKQVDGIIAVDTSVVQQLLTVTGPVKVQGYKDQFTKDNVLGLLMQYTDYVQVGKADRKSLLGDLMGSVLAFVSDFGRDKMQPLLTTVISLLNEKHILLYFNDPKAQAAVEKFNWAGRVKAYDGDYLYINDANFASGKANLYMKERVEQKIEEKDGAVVKILTINYENTGNYNGILNANYRDALRIYVPKGSVMISSSGSVNNKVDTYEEFGKTVFDTFMFTYAKNKSTFTITYRLPGSIKKRYPYKLLLQKQPGVEGLEEKITVFGKPVDPFVLRQDREIIVEQ